MAQAEFRQGGVLNEEARKATTAHASDSPMVHPTADPEASKAANGEATGAEAAEAPAGDATPVDAAEAPTGDATPVDDAAKAPGADAAPSGEAAPATPEPSATSSPKKAPPRAGAASLYRAFRSNRPLEGHVERVIKGGYEIKVGRARGFCPHSQMDVQRVEDGEVHVGKTYMFRITQVRRGGADVVLSRRMLLEEARKEEAKAVHATLIEGSIMQGHIAGTAPFGAFVDLGAGVMGLVHVSELSHSRVTEVAGAVNVGDTVQVKILKLDDKRGRVSLSIRQAEADPASKGWLQQANYRRRGEAGATDSRWVRSTTGSCCPRSRGNVASR
jgi:small subunit ribosomal protein S1